ncbi:MAG: hypothetical protein Q7R70_02325 [Candidatus Diapherotrites archaeon]|nr:hypothetical protein [Candidatus Diapherotrites archaeon]
MPSKPIGKMTRRRFLWNAAKIGAAGTGVAALWKMLPSPSTLKEGARPIEVSTRKPNSLKRIIEQWPDVRNREIALTKKQGKAGTVYYTKLGARSESRVIILSNPETRSLIHTHSLGAINKRFPRLPESENKKVLSTPSSTDVLTFLENVNRRLAGKNQVRNSHVACLDEKGRFVGYFSMRFPEKSPKVENIKAIGAAAISHAEKYKALYMDGRFADMEKEIDNFRNFLFNDAKKLGLRVRAVPNRAEGFEYSNGIFRQKPVR